MIQPRRLVRANRRHERAALWLRRPVHDQTNPRVHHRADTHQAGLHRYVQRATGQSIVAHLLRGRAHRVDFGMRRGIEGADRAVASGANHEALGRDHDRANRNFAEPARAFGLREREAHCRLVCQTRHRPVQLYAEIHARNGAPGTSKIGRMGLTRTLAAAIVVLGTAGVAAKQDDIFRTLGTTSDQAESSIFGSFTSGAIALIGERAVFKAATAETRATLVGGVIAAARAYAGTADFATRYALFRELQRPQREVLPQTGDEALAAQQKQLEEVVREAQKTAESLPAEARQQLADNIAEMKKQLAELNADPEHRAAVDAVVRESAREAEANYVRQDAEFEVEYPEDARQLIARRLRAFLDLSATIDFSAALVEKDKKMRFADPVLEARSREWKMLYRAGKPAVDAARAAAEAWLKALGV